MDLLKISTTTTTSKSSFSIDSLLDRGQKEAADAEDVPNEDEVEVDISITEDLQRPPPILIKPTPRLPFEDSEELDCTEVNIIYLFQRRKIFCIYVPIPGLAFFLDVTYSSFYLFQVTYKFHSPQKIL